MHLLRALQDSAFSTWMRESDWAIFAFLIFHTLGMGVLVGTGVIVNLRILGAVPQLPLQRLARLIPLMWLGLAVAICSGVLLVIGYPAKALTNPWFYVKLTLLASAIAITRLFAKRLFTDSLADGSVAPQWARLAAIVCTVLWLCGLSAGKFLPYTNRVLLLY
jgi:hypothetical protein